MKKLLPLITLAINLCSAMEQKTDWKPWDPKLYDAHSNMQYQTSLKSLQKFDLSSPQFKTIVELGCRTANISSTLAQQHPDKTFVGIDPQADVIDFGTTKHTNSSNLKLICDSAQRYSLKHYDVPPADFVGCYHMLHWIPREDLPTVFNNIAANLDAHGVVDIITSAQQETTTLTTAVIRTIIQPTWWWYLPSCIGRVLKGQDSLTLLSIDELRQIATQSGLLIDCCELVEESVVFNSQEDFCPWLLSILKPHGIDNIPKDRQEEFVKSAADLYCAQYNPATDGTIVYRFKQIHLTAHKSS